MDRTITATELARNLSDILNRVRYRGETFSVERNGEVIATIEPPKTKKTWGALMKLLETQPQPDPQFWDDVEAVHRMQPEMPKSAWDK